MADAEGIWLSVDDLALGWSPRRLLAGEFAVQALTAAHIELARLPTSTAGNSGGAPFALPLPIRLQRLRVDRIDIAKPAIGIAAAFGADGQGEFLAMDRAQGFLALRRLDKPGEYRLDARQDEAGLHARLRLREQDDGLLAAAAGIAELGPITADATADGPPDALASHIVLDAGKLHAQADGTIDLGRQRGEMVVATKDIAPIAALAGLELQGSTRLTIRGTLLDRTTHLEADGTLDVTGGPAKLAVLVGQDAKLRVAADLRGGDITLTDLALTGAAGTATAKGSLIGETLALDWTLGLAELRLLVPTLGGALQATGHLAGPLADFAATADITGTAAPPGIKGGPLSAHVEARGLPDAPAGNDHRHRGIRWGAAGAGAGCGERPGRHAARHDRPGHLAQRAGAGRSDAAAGAAAAARPP